MPFTSRYSATAQPSHYFVELVVAAFGIVLSHYFIELGVAAFFAAFAFAFFSTASISSKMALLFFAPSIALSAILKSSQPSFSDWGEGSWNFGKYEVLVAKQEIIELLLLFKQTSQ